MCAESRGALCRNRANKRQGRRPNRGAPRGHRRRPGAEAESSAPRSRGRQMVPMRRRPTLTRVRFAGRLSFSLWGSDTREGGRGRRDRTGQGACAAARHVDAGPRQERSWHVCVPCLPVVGQRSCLIAARFASTTNSVQCTVWSTVLRTCVGVGAACRHVPTPTPGGRRSMRRRAATGAAGREHGIKNGSSTAYSGANRGERTRRDFINGSRERSGLCASVDMPMPWRWNG